MMIRVVTQYPPDAEGLRFLERAKAALEAAGIGFGHRQFAAPEI
jgi:hypothetical protein